GFAGSGDLDSNAGSGIDPSIKTGTSKGARKPLFPDASTAVCSAITIHLAPDDNWRMFGADAEVAEERLQKQHSRSWPRDRLRQNKIDLTVGNKVTAGRFCFFCFC